VLYTFLGTNILGCSVLMPFFFQPRQSEADATGKRVSMAVPRRSRNMVQHELNEIDYTYIALNTLCMPGFFYHFFCLMRSWGFDPAAPPSFDSSTAITLLTETIPGALVPLALYFTTYEFFYYWWHRAMHEVPALYKWVHKHHHQQTYPDRAVIDTLNTGCVESQVGLYSQLAMLWAYGSFIGVANVPAACIFFAAAGCMSVLEHDGFERSAPFNLFEAREHHMHHAYVKCNYSPYGTLWDEVFGTYKKFDVRKYSSAKKAADIGPFEPSITEPMVAAKRRPNAAIIGED